MARPTSLRLTLQYLSRRLSICFSSRSGYAPHNLFSRLLGWASLYRSPSTVCICKYISASYLRTQSTRTRKTRTSRGMGLENVHGRAHEFHKSFTTLLSLVALIPQIVELSIAYHRRGTGTVRSGSAKRPFTVLAITGPLQFAYPYREAVKRLSLTLVFRWYTDVGWSSIGSALFAIAHSVIYYIMVSHGDKGQMEAVESLDGRETAPPLRGQSA